MIRATPKVKHFKYSICDFKFRNAVAEGIFLRRICIFLSIRNRKYVPTSKSEEANLEISLSAART